MELTTHVVFSDKYATFEFDKCLKFGLRRAFIHKYFAKTLRGFKLIKNQRSNTKNLKDDPQNQLSANPNKQHKLLDDTLQHGTVEDSGKFRDLKEVASALRRGFSVHIV